MKGMCNMYVIEGKDSSYSDFMHSGSSSVMTRPTTLVDDLDYVDEYEDLLLYVTRQGFPRVKSDVSARRVPSYRLTALQSNK